MVVAGGVAARVRSACLRKWLRIRVEEILFGLVNLRGVKLVGCMKSSGCLASIIIVARRRSQEIECTMRPVR